MVLTTQDSCYTNFFIERDYAVWQKEKVEDEEKKWKRDRAGFIFGIWYQMLHVGV